MNIALHYGCWGKLSWSAEYLAGGFDAEALAELAQATFEGASESGLTAFVHCWPGRRMLIGMQVDSHDAVGRPHPFLCGVSLRGGRGSVCPSVSGAWFRQLEPLLRRLIVCGDEATLSGLLRAWPRPIHLLAAAAGGVWPTQRQTRCWAWMRPVIASEVGGRG